jgi:hypothetical protein
VDDLTLQIRFVDDVEVNDAYGPDPRRRKIQGERAPKPTRAHRQDLRGLELLLPVEGYLGHDQVPAVACDLLIAKFDRAVGRPY